MITTTPVRPVPASRPLTGLPEWKPYVYRGKGYDTLTPELDDAVELPDEPQCYCGGDMSGYRKHLADGEKPCRESRDYTNAYHRELARLKRISAAVSGGGQ